MIPLGVLASAYVAAAGGGGGFTYLGGGVSTATTTTAAHTITGLDFGAEASNRVIVAVVGRRVASGRNLVSVTIGGVTATIDAKSPTWDSAIIARAVVPTGTSGDVVITLNSTEAGPRYADIYAAYGTVGVLSAASAYSGGTTTTSATINPATSGGHLFAVAHSSSVAGTVSWTWVGYTQDSSGDAVSSHVSHIYEPGLPSGSQSVSVTSSSALYQGLAVAAYSLT